MGTQSGLACPFFIPLPRYARGENGLRINAVFQRLAWLERNGVAGLDFDGLGRNLKEIYQLVEG